MLALTVVAGWAGDSFWVCLRVDARVGRVRLGLAVAADSELLLSIGLCCFTAQKGLIIDISILFFDLRELSVRSVPLPNIHAPVVPKISRYHESTVWTSSYRRREIPARYT